MGRAGVLGCGMLQPSSVTHKASLPPDTLKFSHSSRRWYLTWSHLFSSYLFLLVNCCCPAITGLKDVDSSPLPLLSPEECLGHTGNSRGLALTGPCASSWERGGANPPATLPTTWLPKLRAGLKHQVLAGCRWGTHCVTGSPSFKQPSGHLLSNFSVLHFLPLNLYYFESSLPCSSTY